MNLILLRQIGLLGIIVGLAMGLIAHLPFIGSFLFIIYFLLLSAFMIVYLKRINVLGKITVKEGGVMGAVLGFFSVIACCIVYIPIAMIVQFIFKTNYVGMFMINAFSNIGFLICVIFLLFFFGLLAALMNGFSGAVTAYIYEVLEEYQKNQGKPLQNPEFNMNDFNQKGQ